MNFERNKALKCLFLRIELFSFSTSNCSKMARHQASNLKLILKCCHQSEILPILETQSSTYWWHGFADQLIFTKKFLIISFSFFQSMISFSLENHLKAIQLIWQNSSSRYTKSISWFQTNCVFSWNLKHLILKCTKLIFHKNSVDKIISWFSRHIYTTQNTNLLKCERQFRSVLAPKRSYDHNSNFRNSPLKFSSRPLRNYETKIRQLVVTKISQLIVSMAEIWAFT